MISHTPTYSSRLAHNSINFSNAGCVPLSISVSQIRRGSLLILHHDEDSLLPQISEVNTAAYKTDTNLRLMRADIPCPRYTFTLKFKILV